MNGLDPEAYLSDALERMVSGRTTNDRLHELLAWNWKPESKATPTVEAAAEITPLQGKAIGSAAVSASAASAWIASRISRSVVCSK